MDGAALFQGRMGRKLVFLAALAMAGAVAGGTADAADKKAGKATAKTEARKVLAAAEMLGMEVLAADNERLGQVVARRIGARDYDLVLRLDDEGRIPQLIADGIVARPNGPGASVTTLFGPETVAVSSALLRPAGGERAGLILRSTTQTAMR